jgi:hypothetical protein
VSWTTTPTALTELKKNKGRNIKYVRRMVPMLHKANIQDGEIAGLRKACVLDDGVLVWPIATIPGVSKVALLVEALRSILAARIEQGGPQHGGGDGHSWMNGVVT